MEQPAIGGNLLLVALAYNGGSGSLPKYQRVLQHGDPLMAIESIGCEETRGFVQRVLAYYWTYQAKLGHDSASLTDLAEGRWPRYRWGNTMDGATLAAAD
jgi:soluble lytic murein transglycosylase-like protein